MSYLKNIQLAVALLTVFSLDKTRGEFTDLVSFGEGSFDILTWLGPYSQSASGVTFGSPITFGDLVGGGIATQNWSSYSDSDFGIVLSASSLAVNLSFSVELFDPSFANILNKYEGAVVSVGESPTFVPLTLLTAGTGNLSSVGGIQINWDLSSDTGQTVSLRSFATASAIPQLLGPGSYKFPSEAKVKLGVAPVQGAAYQWLRSGAIIKSARNSELDLTPSATSFGPTQTGVYQLRQQQGTTVTTLGPWIITHDDPTILVYNLILKGTGTTSPQDAKTKGASESPINLAGFMLLDRTASDIELEAVLILTRSERVGTKIVQRLHRLEDQRHDVAIHSNGPVPGTKKFPPSRTLVTGLLGTQAEQINDDAQQLLWLAGDKDVLWISGNDALIKLGTTDKSEFTVAPALMNGVLGMVKFEDEEIENLNVTATINRIETLEARKNNRDLESVKNLILDRLSPPQ